MSHGKGYDMREIERIMKDNDYRFVRFNGHYIYKGINGNTVAIPRTCCRPLIQRVFRENGIEIKGTNC